MAFKPIKNFEKSEMTGGYAFENKRPFSELIEQTVILTRFFIQDNEDYGYQSAVIEFYFEDNPELMQTTQTSSKIIMKQLEDNKENLPLRVKVNKRDSKAGFIYYTFEEPTD